MKAGKYECVKGVSETKADFHPRGREREGEIQGESERERGREREVQFVHE